MKRSGPLRRSGRLVRSKPLKRGKGLKPGKPLKRGKPLKQGKGFKRKPPPTRSPYETMLKAAFDLAVLKPDGRRAKCIVCGAPADDAHHVLSKQIIKAWALTHGLDDDQLADLLWDPRNGVAVCRRDHDLHENGSRRIRRVVLPRRVFEFSDELELTHRIDSIYPAS